MENQPSNQGATKAQGSKSHKLGPAPSSSKAESSSLPDRSADEEKYPPGGGKVVGIPKDRFDKVTSTCRKQKQ